MNKKQKFSYIFGGLFISIMLIIMVGISIFLINRTNSTLVEIYWKQGELVVESIAIGARQTIDSVQLTPHQVTRDLKKLIYNIEQIERQAEASNKTILENIAESQSIYSISLINTDGDVETYVESELYLRNLEEYQHNQNTFIENSLLHKKETEVLNIFEQEENDTSLWRRSVSMSRKDGKGKIKVTFGLEKLMEIKYHVGLQIFIASLENRGIIKYITFLDEELKVIADTDLSKINTFPDKLEYQDALISDASYFFLNDDVMDIIQPFYIDHNVKGVFKIGFPTTKIATIHKNTVRNTFIFSGWFMFLTILITFLALRFQSVYLAKNDLIERQAKENQFLVSLANLAAGVAHEVRNPLNSISMTIQRLQLEFLPIKKEEQEEYLSFTELMKKEVQRINSIITDFLGFSKPFKLDSEQFKIGDFLQEIISLFEPEATNKGVKITTKISQKETLYSGDQDKLNQVIVNLLKNSLDASREGGKSKSILLL